jgi:hypothetical protein
VLEKVQEKEDQDKQKQAAVENRKVMQQQKERDQFCISYKKYIGNEQLTVVDIRSMLKKIKERDDLPIASKKDDLYQQWEFRKHRLDAFRILPPLVQQPRIMGDDVEIPVHPTGIFLDLPEIQTMGSTTGILSTLAENENSTDVIPKNIEEM